MKAVLISYNQALTEAVNSILDRHNIKGFTKWATVHGRGTNGGEPHFGSHTWPSMNSVILSIMEEEKIESLLESLQNLNQKAEMQGLRAFVWNIETMI